MAAAKTNYAGASDLPITLASLASDTNLLSDAESAAVDNTVDGRREYWVSGKITTGTSPTESRQIEVLAVGSWDRTKPAIIDRTCGKIKSDDDCRSFVLQPYHTVTN